MGSKKAASTWTGAVIGRLARKRVQPPATECHHSFSHSETLLRFILFLPLFMAKDNEFSGIIYCRFQTKHILHIVHFNGILVDLMADTDAIIETGHSRHNFIP